MDQMTTNVLLIEDNAGDADLVRLRLVEGQSPVKVNCVNRLSDGLASLTSETPSVVLLDLNLPDCRGAETFRRVMEHSPNVPVVVLSGQDDEALAMRAVHSGVQDYLVKNNLSSKHLERAILDGNLKVPEIPQAWNALSKELLGIVPPTDTLGCLQDIHWAMGLFGYFPTYTLGALTAAQFWGEAATAAPRPISRSRRARSAAHPGVSWHSYRRELVW